METRAALSRSRMTNVPTPAEVEWSMRIERSARSKCASPTSARSAAGVDSLTPVDGVAVKLRIRGATESCVRVRFTQMVWPGDGFTVASAAAYPLSVARIVCGLATIQSS